jgi:oligogalacturonide transport system substrate-binding protein
MKLKAGLLTFFFISVMVIAYGCSPSDNPSAVREKTAIRFAWWGEEPRNRATIKAIDLYSSKNPDVRIVGEYADWEGYYYKIKTQLASMNAPDIISTMPDWKFDILNSGIFVDLADKRYRQYIDTGGMDPRMLDSLAKKDGALLGVPLGLSYSNIIINNGEAKRAGIGFGPDAKLDWEQFISLGKKYSASNKDKIFLLIDLPSLRDNVFIPYLIQTSGRQWINDDCTAGFSKEDAVKAFQLVKGLYDSGLVQPIQQTMPYSGRIAQNPKWPNGLALLTMGRTTDIQLLKAENIDIAVARLPVKKGASLTGIKTDSIMASIYKNSSNIESSIAFINWFLNEEEAIGILGDCRGYPVVDNAVALLAEEGKFDPVVEMSDKIAGEAPAMPYLPITGNAELLSICDDAIFNVADGKLSAEQAGMKFYNSITGKLNEIFLNTRW